MQVTLFKKEDSYVDKKTNETKKVTRSYVGCGSTLIPVEVTYFENTELGRDPQFASRKAVLKAFAEDLPEKKGNAHG